MKESYQSGPLPENKDKSIKNTIGKVGVGIAATVASLAMPNDVVAQKGLVGRFMDKIHPKTEQVSGDKAENNQAEKNDSIIYNSESDKEGFKYPFSKVYESDKDFYRTVAYAHDFTLEGAHEDAFFEALIKLKEENNLSKTSLISIIEETYLENKETGIITSVVAIKMPRSEESKKSQGQETKFIGGVKDKDGVEYPFSKVYESDKDFYRVMAMGTGYDDRSMTETVAEGVAYDKIRTIIAEELKINGDFLHLEMHPKTIVSRYDKNTKTGIYTNYIAVEIPRSNVKVEKINPEIKKIENISGKIIDNKQAGKDNFELKEDINKVEGIRQVEIKDIKDLKDLLKDYDQVLSSFPYKIEVVSIMQEILKNDLRVVVAETNAKTINIAQMLLENKFDVLESSSGIKSYKSNRHFGGGIIFYKELPGNSRKVLLLKLYKKTSPYDNVNPTENLSKPLNTENKINLPEPSPVSGKPEKQPEYVKPTPENTVNFTKYKKAHEAELESYKKDQEEGLNSYKKGFDDYKKAQQSKFDEFKKAKQAEFDKFRNNQENK